MQPSFQTEFPKLKTHAITTQNSYAYILLNHMPCFSLRFFLLSLWFPPPLLPYSYYAPCPPHSLFSRWKAPSAALAWHQACTYARRNISWGFCSPFNAAISYGPQCKPLPQIVSLRPTQASAKRAPVPSVVTPELNVCCLHSKKSRIQCVPTSNAYVQLCLKVNACMNPTRSCTQNFSELNGHLYSTDT